MCNDKIAFLFSGQGAQEPGMMKELYESIEECRIAYDTADSVLGRSIKSLCFDGSDDDLALTHNTQPCVLAADLTAYYAVIANGIIPDVVAGFSLGEYAALVASRVILLEDVFRIVQIRADAMQEAVPVGNGAMAAVELSDERKAEELCNSVEGYVEVANYNCPGQIVVSGEKDAVKKIIKLAKNQGIRATRLPVSAPFHCKMMKLAAERLEKVLNKIALNNARFPVYMNVDAKVEIDASVIKNKLIKQTISPVRWEQTIRNMYDDGVRKFIELGPGETLSNFVRKSLTDKNDIMVYSVSNNDTLKKCNLGSR